MEDEIQIELEPADTDEMNDQSEAQSDWLFGNDAETPEQREAHESSYRRQQSVDVAVRICGGYASADVLVAQAKIIETYLKGGTDAG